jgi:hypothetical protein
MKYSYTSGESQMNYLKNQIAALDYARNALVKPRLEVAQLNLLLNLRHQKEAQNMQELAKLLSHDASFISRNAKAFGSGSSGPQVIVLTIDYESPRFRLCSLTDAGKRIVDTYVGILGGEEAPRTRQVQDARKRG